MDKNQVEPSKKRPKLYGPKVQSRDPQKANLAGIKCVSQKKRKHLTQRMWLNGICIKSLSVSTTDSLFPLKQPHELEKTCTYRRFKSLWDERRCFYGHVSVGEGGFPWSKYIKWRKNYWGSAPAPNSGSFILRSKIRLFRDSMWVMSLKKFKLILKTLSCLPSSLFFQSPRAEELHFKEIFS